MSEVGDAPSWSVEVNQWRENGNEHFRQQEWQKALDCYKSGLALLDSESSEDAKVARCLLNGNTAQAAFQLGHYSDSFDWAMQALDSGVAKDPVKLRFRAAMSLLYANRFEECRKLFPDVSQVLSTISEVEHAKEKPFRLVPPSGRASPRVEFEYYWFGNEMAGSYLTPASQKQTDHRVCLIGSSGDARHVQATIRDFAVRKNALLELHVVDLEARTCASALILFSILTAWGKARSQKVAGSLQDKLFDLYWYVLLSMGIPRSYLTLLDTIIESLCDVLANPTSTLASAKKPSIESLLKEAAWLLVSSKTYLIKSSHVTAVRTALESWHSKSGDPICPLSELREFLFSDQLLDSTALGAGLTQAKRDQAKPFFNMMMMTPGTIWLESLGQTMPNPHHVLTLAEPGTVSFRPSSGAFKVDWSRVSEAKFRKLLEDAFHHWLYNAPDREIHAWLTACKTTIFHMGGKIGKDLTEIQQRFLITMPDSDSITQTRREAAGDGGEWDPTYPVDTIQSLLAIKSREEVDRTFVVNPTSAIYPSKKDPSKPKLRDCVEEITMERTLQCVHAFTAWMTDVRDLMDAESMVARMGRFAQPIADLLFTVCSGAPQPKMRLTYACESADAFSVDRLRRLDLAKLAKKPVPYYDIVRMSNVPDYFGLLNSCLGFLPLLKPRNASTKRTGGAPFLSHEILYNTSTFPSMEAYTRTGLCVPTGKGSECTRVGFRLVEGDIFSPEIRWDRVMPQEKHTLSISEALEWVQRVFRSVTEAPVQAPGQRFAEIFPNTIVTFFRAVDWLVREAYILPHHASQICDQFFTEKDVVLTRAKAPFSTSNEAEENIAPSIKAFQKELRAVGSLMRVQFAFPLVPLTEGILVPSNEVRNVVFKLDWMVLGHLASFEGLRGSQTSHDFNGPLGLGLIVVETDEDLALVAAGFKQSCWIVGSTFRGSAKPTMATSDLQHWPRPVCHQFLPYIMSKLSRKSSVHLFSSIQLKSDKTCSAFMCARDVEFFESKADRTVVFLYMANLYSISEFAEEVHMWKDTFVSSDN